MNCFLATISFLHFVVINVILGFDDLSSGKPTIIEPPQNGLCGGSGCHIEYTVDGNQSTCAVTEEGTPDTWYVDLLQVENIARIWIHYKMPDPSETKRKVHNYQVFLSNTTRRQEGSLCIDDTGPIFPLPGDVKNCPALARFVIFHSAISHGSATTIHYSQICEVKVEGCKRSGMYGQYCDKRCPDNCGGDTCTADLGDCYSCTDGWVGPKCQTQCPFGKYGSDCRENCSGHCRGNMTCDPFSGFCREDCESVERKHCASLCMPGWYGKDCSRRCSKNCLNASCDVTHGTCLFGHTLSLPHHDDGIPIAVVVGVTLGTLLVIIIVIGTVVIARRRCRQQAGDQQSSNPKDIINTRGDVHVHVYEKLSFANNHI